MSNMAYADDYELRIEAEEDGSQPDRDQDLKPRFHVSRFHGSDEVEDDDDVVNIWNLRKCSVAALDIRSNVFGDEILPTLMPIVEDYNAKLFDFGLAKNGPEGDDTRFNKSHGHTSLCSSRIHRDRTLDSNE